MCHEVRRVIEAAAASSYVTPSGIRTAFDSGSLEYSQYPPHRGPVSKPQMRLLLQSYSLPAVHLLQVRHDRFPCETILSPGFMVLTSGPTAVTLPAASLPDMWGSGTARGLPLMPQMSS